MCMCMPEPNRAKCAPGDKDERVEVVVHYPIAK